jgi:hypothetical protein
VSIVKNELHNGINQKVGKSNFGNLIEHGYDTLKTAVSKSADINGDIIFKDLVTALKAADPHLT